MPLPEALDAAEARVLGALIEKEATTPEYYPLSLNALTLACNQKSNRSPVVEYDEHTVTSAIDRLRNKHLAAVIVGNGRVHKYAQRISERLNLGRRELAILCTLLLRGPQTLGEIKDRSERIFSFSDLEELERVLEKMAEFAEGAMVRRMARMTGQKEARFAHLLSGEPPAVEGEPAAASYHVSRPAHVEGEIQTLRDEVADLKRRLERLESLFS